MYRYINFVNYVLNFIQHPAVKADSISRRNYWDRECGLRRNRSTIDHTSSTRQILEKKFEFNEAVHQLFIDFKIAYDSVRREVLYNILFEFGTPMKVVRLRKMCLKENYSRDRKGKHLSDMFPIRTCLKEGDGLSPLFSTLL